MLSHYLSQTKPELTQIRARITKYHAEKLAAIEQRTGVDASTVIRLALDVLLPRVKNIEVGDIDKKLNEIFL